MMSCRLFLKCSLALYLVATAPIWLTACADDDDNDVTGDDDDDDDDVTGDDDDVTDDDDDLPACWTITTQPECEAREDCYAVVETTWWYFDATAARCKSGEEPIFTVCSTRDDDYPGGLGCAVFQLATGVAAALEQPFYSEKLFPLCGMETNDPACACCDGGSDTGE